MKQLTFILILTIPFTFQNCSNQESDLNGDQEETAHSRSIPNIFNVDCIEVDEFIPETKKNDIISRLHTLDNNQNIFQLPSLKDKAFNQSDSPNKETRKQSIFDDYDPESI